MQDKNLQNQSLNQTGSLPPLPQNNTTLTNGAVPAPQTDANWPGKKKSSKLKYILGGFLALLIVGGVSFGSYYFASTDVPTAPSSEPQAARNSDGVWINPKFQNPDGSLNERGKEEGLRVNENGVIIRGGEESGDGGANTGGQSSCSTSGPTNMKVTNISPTSVKLTWTPGVGNYVKLWVSTSSDPTGACNPLPNKTVNDVCVANENGSRVGSDDNHADIPATTTEWVVNNLKPSTKYYWRHMMWTYSGCDSGTAPLAFTTTAEACVSGVNTFAKQDSCTATGITDGAKSISYTCKNQLTKEMRGITRTTCTELSSLRAQAELLCKQQNPCPGETACVDSTWTPNVNTICKDTTFLQKSNCNIEREAVGTKTDGTCAACTNETWSPAANTVCEGEEFTQKSSCDATKTRTATGTKTDGTCGGTGGLEPELTIEKRAYEDESTNKAGDYDMNYEVDMVSKNQVIVYAFEVTNDGDVNATDIKVKDILKGDNRELLTYMDGDSDCSYASSSRTVTCDGMDLKPGESGVYAFRVKVSDSAINGDTIKNVGEISYKDMPSGNEIDSSNELVISTVVGCNHVCTSDDECSGGLTCDPDANKCRRPACSDATSCNCPVERDDTEPTPTRRAATQRPEPTELVEAGILDFPGVAAFGGGLLLAVIGILLAL